MQQPDGCVPAAHEARGSLHDRHAAHWHVLPARHWSNRQHGHRVGLRLGQGQHGPQIDELRNDPGERVPALLVQPDPERRCALISRG
eukprot:13386557-Heterocapsa_arctica.AAC.1